MAEEEWYARGEAELYGVMCHPGVEIREGDDIDEMTVEIRILASKALHFAGGNHRSVVNFVKKRIKERWPDRAYFIETEEAGRGVQVYQPYGMPRERVS